MIHDWLAYARLGRRTTTIKNLFTTCACVEYPEKGMMKSSPHSENMKVSVTSTG